MLFDKLRADGKGVNPFMVSLSNHERLHMISSHVIDFMSRL